MKKRILSVLLAICLLVSVLPIGTVLSTAESTTPSDVTITVVDENGKNITDSALSVKVTHAYGNNWLNYTENVVVTNYGNGVFGYDSSDYNRNNYQFKTKYYTINATLTVDGRTYSTSVQAEKDATSVVITLDDFIQGDKWAKFDVYYIADGHFPNVFYGYGEPEDYGPGRNDTPLLTINVNLTKLQSPEYYDCVVYQQNVENAYHFIPAKQSEADNLSEKYEENLKYATDFWEAVKACMDEESVEAFKATGLYYTFIGYCLKNQSKTAVADNHCDGILSVKPPVYVIEMYNHDGEIFGGHTNDVDTIVANPITMDKVLDAYNKHFNQEIKWTDDGNGVWRGSYITKENGRQYRYNLKIVQTNIAQANGYTSKDKDGNPIIKYQKKTDTYYLAQFKSETQSIERVDFTVTYTDGVKDDVFNDQVTSHEKGNKAAKFEGNTDRENYIFLGWTLEGGDGTILSEQDIQDISVNEDLVFVAAYAVAPSKYTGTVEVILNGSYDSTTATATGTRVDIADIMGSNVSLYLSVDGTDFIPLERVREGVYNAQLLNGIYHIYYYNGTEYFLSSNQELTIHNDHRTRYIFFNSVNYDLNGGVGGPELLLRYFYSGRSVTVDNAAPTRDGYIFTGWKDQDGKDYNSGALLTSDISKAYTLTAQWVDAADVYINVTINHDENGEYDESQSKGDITLDLVYTPDKNTPYLETGDRFVLDDTNHPKFDCTSSLAKTVYTAKVPAVSDVSKDYYYSVVTEKVEYNVSSVTTNKLDNGDIVIDVVLDYAPKNKDIYFNVIVDSNVPANLLPQAAIVKLVHWSSERNVWEIIPQLENKDGVLTPGVRVEIDPATREGSAHYHVWANELLENNTTTPYGYRMIVTALVYPDGSIVAVNVPYLDGLAQNNTDLYTIKFGEVLNGKDCGGLNGAYFIGETQNGVLDAVISATGYSVTFDAQGGTVNGYDKQTIDNQYKVPSFDGYVPVRNGGYVFDGWYKDSACTEPAVAGEYLSKNITLYAKWKEPLKVEGIITVGATFEQVNEDSTVTIQPIFENARAKEVIVILQRIDANGYTETIKEMILPLDYTQTKYYHKGRVVGFAEYAFSEIPDDGAKYRIQVLIPNYHPTFQNEKDNNSLNRPLDYPSYNLTDYVAEFGTTDPKTATVNVHNHFAPESFELKYSVNTETIGKGFRPQQTEILVTYDEFDYGVIPSKWPVITQMLFGDNYNGDFIDIINGKGNGSCNVWIRRPDGITEYQYGIKIEDIVLYNGTSVKYSDSLPFNIMYEGPAYYLDGVQNKQLVATLTPKTYKINYVTNGGVLTGDYPTEHIWSYATSIEGIVPTFDGYKFAGWYLDEELTIPAGDYIDASVAADTTLYAKSIQIKDEVDLIVTVKHTQINSDGTEGGLAGNYDKTLYTQLTYADRNIPSAEQVFIDMQGYAKEYRDGYWHTHGDKVKVDIFEVPRYYANLSSEYDYGVNVMLEGYYVSEKTVERVNQPDGSTRHKVYITLQFNPDIINLQFYVGMADGVHEDVYPKSAEVKVTSWFDDPAADIDWDWTRITQHVKTTVTVNIDSEKGYGIGTYPVWQWYNKEKGIPYHFRIEVIQLNMADGTAVPMNETIADVSYSGGGYNAEIKVTGGTIPEVNNDEHFNTKLDGVYGKPIIDGGYAQQGTVGAIIDVNKVIFHANNNDALCFDSESSDDTFRTYYPSGSVSSGSKLLTLNSDGTITPFYEIPEFEYNAHNKYVFKGWYLDKESEENPVDWNAVYSGTTHIYAHWIETGTVAKEEADGKKTGGVSYIGFDLIGAQIRDKKVNHKEHYGVAGSGLRFITVLSESLYAEINAIAGNASGAEYGFVLARSSTTQRYAGTTEGYTLQYKGENTNGVNTNESYSYVQNLKCSGVEDHYASDAYRLYTAVITYKNYEGERLEQEYNESFAARSYIRYYDANGLLRTHYNNYTGTQFYGGYSTSFAAVREVVTK